MKLARATALLLATALLAAACSSSSGEAVDTMMGEELHDAVLAIIGASFGWAVDGSTAVEVLVAR